LVGDVRTGHWAPMTFRSCGTTLLRSYSGGLDDLRPTLQLALDEGVELLQIAISALRDAAKDRAITGRYLFRH
jgi:hypothetical protein